MSRYLPPLNSLRAYECAARHMSFTLASQELNVTPAAISHQVKVLEKHLGVPLFTRLTRKLVLTQAGESMLAEVSEALDKISGAVGGVKRTVVNERLTLRLGPSLAARWLSPRLHLFWQQFPQIDLYLLHSNSPVNFDREDIDLAITYGKGDWSGVVVSHLLDSDFFPVCSPGLLDAHARATQASCLEDLTLLHDASYEGWENWLQLAGMSGVSSHRGPIIDDTNVLIQAALNGQGIALGSTLLVQEYLDAGQLVRPFETELKSDSAYYIVCPSGHLRRPAVQEFKNWLLQYRVPG